jgi:hypothetical protein
MTAALPFACAGGRSTRSFTFWLPGAGQPMHWGYYSCNGMSADVAETAPERDDPTYLWRDVLQLHAAFPLHCMVGGGASAAAAAARGIDRLASP